MADFSKQNQEGVGGVSNTSEDHDQPYPRAVVFGVFILSALIIFVMVRQLRSNLVLEIPTFGTDETYQDERLSLFEQEDEALKIQDSDFDGLSDYDELKVFGTSPYIADTDSDGIPDIEEVNTGTDPNCAEGQTCFGGGVTTEGTFQSGSPYATPEVTSLVDDPVELRKVLIAAGADPLVINSLDDQTIQIIAQEALYSLSNPTQEKIDLLQQFNPDQIRELLVESGLDEAILSSMTDQEMVEVFQMVVGVYGDQLNSN